MYILNIFHTGGLTLAVSLVCFGLIGYFLYKAHQACGQVIQENVPNPAFPNDATKSVWRYTGERTKYFGSIWPKLAFVVAVLYLVMMLMIASDYKGV